MRLHYLLISSIFLLTTGCKEKATSNDTSIFNLPNSTVELHWDSSVYKLNYCLASIKENNLNLQFSAHPDSLQEYFLEIIKDSAGFNSSIRQIWGVTDCTFVASRFKILNQKIDLDKNEYKKGDSIWGRIIISGLGSKWYMKELGESGLRNNFDTLHLTGDFKTRVH